METCRSCNARIIWALSPAGKRTPLDCYPVTDGNVLLLKTSALDSPLAVVLSGGALETAHRSPVGLRKNHFATCPHAKQHRKEADPEAQRSFQTERLREGEWPS